MGCRFLLNYGRTGRKKGQSETEMTSVGYSPLEVCGPGGVTGTMAPD